MQAVCGGDNPNASSNGLSNIALIRIIKAIRLFKLLRILKLSTFYRSP
jgi:hypothetical protein